MKGGLHLFKIFELINKKANISSAKQRVAQEHATPEYEINFFLENHYKEANKILEKIGEEIIAKYIFIKKEHMFNIRIPLLDPIVIWVDNNERLSIIENELLRLNTLSTPENFIRSLNLATNNFDLDKIKASENTSRSCNGVINSSEVEIPMSGLVLAFWDVRITTYLFQNLFSILQRINKACEEAKNYLENEATIIKADLIEEKSINAELSLKKYKLNCYADNLEESFQSIYCLVKDIDEVNSLFSLYIDQAKKELIKEIRLNPKYQQKETY